MSREELMRLVLAGLAAGLLGLFGGTTYGGSYMDRAGIQIEEMRKNIVSNGEGIAEIRAYLDVLLTREGIRGP